jgi:hypothetical protein
MVQTMDNRSWNMEEFLDSLVLELDKYVDTLSYKGINRKLTYTVKDLALELKLFPEFDGNTVRFTTAKPGDSGASTISIQLGSIRDTQIREISRQPMTKDDISLETIDLADDERKELNRLGIHSAEDLRRAVVDRNVDLDSVTKKKVSYQKLAQAIQQGKRRLAPPQVSRISVAREPGRSVLAVQGNNLSLSQELSQFPLALINDQACQVLEAGDQELRLQVKPGVIRQGSNQLAIALDPFAVVTLELLAG